MTTEDYRADYLRRHAGSGTATGPDNPLSDGYDASRSDHDVLAGFADPGVPTDARTAAIDSAGLDAITRPEVVNALIAVLADTSDRPGVRRAALATLKQLSFAIGEFAPYEAEFRSALRVAATDSDPQLAETSLEVLALHRDDYAQQVVLAGLEDPSRAVVSRQRALRLLGHDLHAAQYPMLRDLVAEKATEPVERVTALRLLAADADSAPVFEQLVADRSEDTEVRATSAVALHNLDPARFAATAERVVLDPDDDDDLRAVCLTTLAVAPVATPAAATPTDLTDAVLNAPTPPSAELVRAVQQYRTSKTSSSGD